MSVPPTAADSSFAGLLHRPLGIRGFFDAVDTALSTVVPFESSCWLGLDPATLLPTCHFTREAGIEHLMSVAANEFMDDDVNKFADLARAGSPVGLLSEATQGVPDRSKRHRDILAPYGFADGDELRAVFSEGGSVWGCVALHRQQGNFTRREAELVAGLGTSYIGEGIHRAVLSTALQEGADDSQAPGLVIVGSEDSVEDVTPAGSRMLAEIVDSTGGPARLPLVVASIVARVRRAHRARSDEMDRSVEVATARVPRATGNWFVLYGSALDNGTTGRVAVMVHPESIPRIPTSLATTYRLSSREAEVSSLVLQGRSTKDIATRLHLSEYTVQDHLKNIFSKVGVHSRRELVARVFTEFYAPRLAQSDGGQAHLGSPTRDLEHPTAPHVATGVQLSHSSHDEVR